MYPKRRAGNNTLLNCLHRHHAVFIEPLQGRNRFPRVAVLTVTVVSKIRISVPVKVVAPARRGSSVGADIRQIDTAATKTAAIKFDIPRE